MQKPLSPAARLRVAVGLAAGLVLLTGCGPTAPTAPVHVPTAPAAVTVSPSPSPSPADSPAAVVAATTVPPRSVPAPPMPAPAGTHAAATHAAACPANDYRNVDGACVPRPTQAAAPPAGATAQCNDGTYSFSQHRSGTCSHHGGVRRWL